MLSGKKLIGFCSVAILGGIGINYHYCGTTRKTLPLFREEDRDKFCAYTSIYRAYDNYLETKKDNKSEQTTDK